jgi:hypothetical protein
MVPLDSDGMMSSNPLIPAGNLIHRMAVWFFVISI